MSLPDKDLEKDPEKTDQIEEDDELDLDDEDLEEDEEETEDEDDSEDDLTDLEKEIHGMKEEDLKDPANAAKVLEAFKNSKSTIAQKKVWRDRATKAGWKKDGEKPAEKPAKKADAPKAEAQGEQARSNERIEFRLDHPDIPRRMIDEIETYAKAKGVTLERAMRSPLVQKMVNDKTLKEKLSKASPSSKHRNPRTTPEINWATATPQQVKDHEAAIRARNVR